MEPDTYPDDLSSEVGVDYTQLRDLLRAGKWEEADIETGQLMLKVSQRGEEEGLQAEDIENFPCTDLRTIDQLWIKYSNGRFGFSVQKRIWEEVGGTAEYNEELERQFGERVGWRRNEKWLYWSDLFFTTQAPAGPLPGGGRLRGCGGVVLVYGLRVGFLISSLSQRLGTCSAYKSHIPHYPLPTPHSPFKC